MGDTARFPYGEKSREELELYSRQITAFLETVPRQAHRGRLLLGHVGGAPGAAGAVRHAHHRRGHAGRASGGGDLALPQDRRAGHGGDRRQRRVSARHPQPRLRRRGHPAGVPRPGRLHRGRGRGEPGARRRGARLHRAAQGAAPGRRHHGLHALPARRAHAAALPGARRHAHQPGRRDRPRGGGHAAAAGPRAPGRRHGLLPLLHHRRRRALPRRRRPLPADAAHARARTCRSSGSPSSSRHEQPVPRAGGGLRRPVRRAHPRAGPQRAGLRRGAVPRRRGAHGVRLLRPGGRGRPDGGHGDRQPRQPDDAGRRGGRRGAHAAGRRRHVRHRPARGRAGRARGRQRLRRGGDARVRPGPPVLGERRCG